MSSQRRGLMLGRGAIAAALCTTPSGGQSQVPQPWTIRDIVEVARIEGIALRADCTAAFILRRPSLARGEDRFGLSVVPACSRGTPRKILEASFLADLQVRPADGAWTFRADLGRGVQLYSVRDDGRVRSLAVNLETALVGGRDGLVSKQDEGARITGVLAYGWAPDGSVLWYSRPVMGSATRRRMAYDRGLVFNSEDMSGSIDMRAPLAAQAIELHILSLRSAVDKIVATAPGDRRSAQEVFQRFSVTWEDSRHLTFQVPTFSEGGDRSVARRTYDLTTGHTVEVSATMAPNPAATPTRFDSSFHLDQCTSSPSVRLVVCNRESLALAPELVAVDAAANSVAVLARPNARYDRIEALRTVHAQWTNRYGSVNDGYVTYPRGYSRGTRYPAIVITHGGDAKNRFVYHAFQWEFPLQVLAERGYVVLSVNEAPKDPATIPAYATGAPGIPVATMQLEWGLKPVASMEAAVQSLIDAGVVDPERVGIAGYSRGAEITSLALAHSTIFRAGAGGDDSWYNSASFWTSAPARSVYSVMFGGSPVDSTAYHNYLAFSPSARARHFAGPLLQEFAAATADRAIELDVALKAARIPTELICFADETHLFYQPRHRAAAMQVVQDWFDYWLLGRVDQVPAKEAQYRRWKAMAMRWRAAPAASASHAPSVRPPAAL